LTELKEVLKNKLLPLIEQENLELVELDVTIKPPHSFLRIYVDKIGGINIDECSHLSQVISDYLDTEDIFQNRYTLEVSSPGVERPLLSLNDFRRKKGKRVKIYIKRPYGISTEITGEIMKVTEKEVILKVQDKEETISRDIITKGKIII